MLAYKFLKPAIGDGRAVDPESIHLDLRLLTTAGVIPFQEKWRKSAFRNVHHIFRRYCRYGEDAAEQYQHGYES
jgi:hypothetical protein